MGSDLKLVLGTLLKLGHGFVVLGLVDDTIMIDIDFVKNLVDLWSFLILWKRRDLGLLQPVLSRRELLDSLAESLGSVAFFQSVGAGETW